jgi:hypothetical protein
MRWRKKKPEIPELKGIDQKVFFTAFGRRYCGTITTFSLEFDQFHKRTKIIVDCEMDDWE